MKKLMILVFFTSLFMILIQSSALSCPEPSPVDVAYDEYDAVLIGTIEDIESNNTNKELTIEVDQSFKGVDKRPSQCSKILHGGKAGRMARICFF